MAWTLAQLKAAIALLGPPIPATDQLKAEAINAQSVTGQIPALYPIAGHLIFGCVVWSEYVPLTADEKTLLREIGRMDQVIGGSSSPFIAPFFGTLAARMPLTIAKLIALAQAATTKVWEPPVTAGDIQTALAQP